MNEHFATELLKEVKTNAKRWFIAFCVMVAVEIVTIFGFLWYITLPIDDTLTEYNVRPDVRPLAENRINRANSP